VLRQQVALVVVVEEELDVAGARAPAGLADRPREREPLDAGRDEQRLAPLEVRTDPDGDVGVAVEQLLIHASSVVSRAAVTAVGSPSGEWSAAAPRLKKQ
jgi:hypothetical protein